LLKIYRRREKAGQAVHQSIDSYNND